MTRDEAVVEMRRLLGFNTGIDASILIDGLKGAQSSLEKEPEPPWFLRTEYSAASTTAAEERLQLPDDFLMIAEDDGLWRFDSSKDVEWKELYKDELDVLRRAHAESDDAEPNAYAVDNLYFRLFPTPDKVYTIKMIYHATATVLDSNTENAWLKHIPWLMIGFATKRVAGSTRDQVAVVEATKIEAEERTRLRQFIIGREVSNRTLEMGDPD